jgi:hypothetical protein
LFISPGPFIYGFPRFRNHKNRRPMPITAAFLPVVSKENLPASAPKSPIVCIRDGSLKLRIKFVSTRVKCFPMRISAALAQWPPWREILTSKSPNLLRYEGLSYWSYFNVNGQQGQFLAALRAFSLILLKKFIRRL